MSKRCRWDMHAFDDGQAGAQHEAIYTCTVCGVQQRLPTHLVWDRGNGWLDPRDFGDQTINLDEPADTPQRKVDLRVSSTDS